MSKDTTGEKPVRYKRASMREVAKLATTSPMTVSRVLSGQTERIAEETRERVLKAARQLDYKPVNFVSQNRQLNTQTMGVLMIHSNRIHLGRMTFGGLSQAADDAGYDLLVRAIPHRLAEDEDGTLQKGHKLLDRLLDRRCDGYIFVGYAPKLVEWLRERDVPVVSCYSDLVPAGVPVVMPDHAMTMKLAVDCLVEAGHSRIGHLAGPSGNTGARLRQEYFISAARDLGLAPEDIIIAGDDRTDDDWGLSVAGIAATKSLLAQGVTAIIAARDDVAAQLKDWLPIHGYNVPEDISLIGIDGEPITVEKQLTTIDLTFEQVGRQAFATLQQLGTGAVFNSPVMVPTQLIERGSVGPPAH